MAKPNANVRALRQIAQAELQSMLDAKLRIASLKRELKECERDYDKAELVIIDKLTRQLPAERGHLYAEIDITSRKIIAWKDEFAAANGPAAVDSIIANTLPTEYRHVKVLSIGQ